MKNSHKGPIVKFLLITVLGCALGFFAAWLTAMFVVIKLTQGVSLTGLALILLWCVLIGGASVWIICTFCALNFGIWRKHHVNHLGFNRFFELGSPEYCCDKIQISAIIEENQAR